MVRSFIDRGEELEVGWGGVVYHGQRLLRQRGGSGGRMGWFTMVRGFLWQFLLVSNCCCHFSWSLPKSGTAFVFFFSPHTYCGILLKRIIHQDSQFHVYEKLKMLKPFLYLIKILNSVKNLKDSRVCFNISYFISKLSGFFLFH